MLRNNCGYQPQKPSGGFGLKQGYNPFSNKSTPLGLENNCKKLIGKNGELVRERQKQVVMGAAQIIKSHCDNIGGNCVDKPNVCPFQRPGANFEIFKIYCCGLYDCHPTDWEL